MTCETASRSASTSLGEIRRQRYSITLFAISLLLNRFPLFFSQGDCEFTR